MDTRRTIGVFRLRAVAWLAALLLPQAVLAESTADVRSDGMRLTVKVAGSSLHSVAEEIAQATGIVFHWMVDQGDEPVEIDLDAMPLRDAIARLMASRNHTVLLGGDGRIRVWVGSVVGDAPASPRESLMPSRSGNQAAESEGIRSGVPMQTPLTAQGGSVSPTGSLAGAATPSGADASSAFGDSGSEPGFDPSPEAFDDASGATAQSGSVDVEGEDPSLDGEEPGQGVEQLFVAEPVQGRALLLEDSAGRARRRSLRAHLSAPKQIALPQPASVGDPRSHGGTLTLWNPATGELSVLTLPATGWTRTQGRDGYLYSDPRREGGACLRVSVRASGAVTARCVGAELEFSLDEPSQGALAIQLALGDGKDALRLCALFGGRIRSDQSGADGKGGRFYATGAPAPRACPALPS